MGFDVLGVFRGAGDNLLAGVTDIEIRQIGDQVQVFTATRNGGGVLSLVLGSRGVGLDLSDQQAVGAGSVLPAPADLDLLDLGGGRQLLLRSGGWSAAPGGWLVDQAGGLGAARVLEGGPTGQITAQATAQIGGKDFLAFGLAGGGVEVWRLTAAGDLIRTAQTDLGNGVQTADISALQTVQQDGACFVLGLTTAGDALAVWELGPGGKLTMAARVGAAAGLGLSDPSALEIAQVGGQTWVFVAGAGSSSISVLSLAGDGSMALTDHVIDTLDTRFMGASALATAVVGDRVFLFAAGGDEGLSVFTLLPDGRLVLLEQQLLTDDLPLDNVTALSAVVVGDRIELVVGIEAAGLIRLSYDPGALQDMLRGRQGDDTLTGNGGADLIWGGGGADSLTGNGGADVIFDGSGADTLQGGSGADVFVLAADDETEVILDFEFGIDRLDLSGWGRIYSVEVLPMAERKGCVVIRWEAEAVYLYTASGRQLDPDLFASSDFFALWHVVAPTVTVGQQYAGSGRAETLTGGAGNDTLLGSAGADLLQGGDGIDIVDYAAAAAPLRADLGAPATNSGLASGDRYSGIEGLAGGLYGDTLRGAAGGDVLLGQGGADLLEGRAGDDRLEGGAGDDRLRPGVGADTVDGGAGFDQVSYLGHSRGAVVDLARWQNNKGAAAGDVLQGIEWVLGSRHDDRITGDGRANLLAGANGADRLAGSGGDDTLRGGAGRDSLTGGAGNDVLSGGDGADWAIYRGRPAVVVNLSLTGPQNTRGQGRDVLSGIENIAAGAGDDRLTGHGGSNRLLGAGGNDRISGGAGADLLWGQRGADTLAGGAGADRLDGGQGADRLLGGGGADAFVFADGGRDMALDLDPAQGDRLLLGGSFADRAAGMTGAQIVARWGVDLGDSVALRFGDDHRIMVDGLASLHQLAAVIDLI